MAERSYNGRNLLAGQNADFENAPPFVAATTTTSRWIDGTAAGSVADATYKWSFTKDAGTVSARFDPAVAFSGSHSIKVDATDASGRGRVVFGSNSGTGASLTASMLATYAIVVKPNRQYTLSYRVKGITLAGSGGRISVHQHNSNGVRVGSVTQPAGSVNGTFDWTLATGTFTTTINTQYLVLSAEQSSAGIQTLWFDDISLTEVLPARTTATSRTTASNRVAVRDMGTALRFDGVNDEVTTPIDSTKFDPTQPFTITFELMDIPFVTTSLGVAGMWLASAGQRNFGISIGSTRRVIFTMRNASDVSVDSTANVSVRRSMRNFVAVRFNGTHMQVYVNGSWNTETAITPAAAGAQAILIGRANVSANPFYKGRIDNFRVFQKALSDAEVDNLNFMNIVPQDGLVAEYLFDEATGTTAIDSSGNGNDGTLSGATYTTDVPLQLRDVV